MYCRKCGAALNEGDSFCRNCGTPAYTNYTPPGAGQGYVSEYSYVEQNPVKTRILSLVKDEMFLALCVLITVYCAFTILRLSFSVFSIVAAVFLWIIYSNGKKQTVSPDNIRNLGTLTLVKYIFNWIGIALTALFLFILAVLFSMINFSELASNSSLTSVFSRVYGEAFTNNLKFLVNNYWILIGWIIAIVLIISTVISILSLIFMWDLRKFLNSVSKSAETGFLSLEKVKKVKGWLIVFGCICAGRAILNVVFAQIIHAIPQGLFAAFYFIASHLVNKYFSDCM